MTITAQYTNDETTRVAELVRAAQGGDRNAFGELFERFERTVFAIALRRLGDYGEAQELCQDVFVQAMQKLDQLRDPACFGGWLRSISHRMAINRAVRRGPALPTEPETLAAICVHRATPLLSALRSEREAQLRAELKSLDPLYRDALEAFYVRGKSLKEISAEFDAPLGTIKRRLFEGRRRLGRKLESQMAV